jgi:hypothetical protein
VTTAWPNAASVGANTAATSAASHTLKPSKRTTAATRPPAIEEDNRRNQTAGDRERHADSQQPGGNCSVATEDSKVDARGIAEEHNDQCDLCDCLDQRVLEAEVHHIEARASDQQAESDKDHWAGEDCV